MEDYLVSIDHISTSMMIADPGRAPGPLPGDISTAILWSFLSKFFINWRKTLNPFVHKLVKYTCNRSICTTALIYRCQSLPIGMRVKLPSKKLSNAINKMENSPTLTFNGKWRSPNGHSLKSQSWLSSWRLSPVSKRAHRLMVTRDLHPDEHTHFL